MDNNSPTSITLSQLIDYNDDTNYQTDLDQILNQF